MTDQERRDIAEALAPFETLLERLMTVIEKLTARVEVLELERLHRHEP